MLTRWHGPVFSLLLAVVVTAHQWPAAAQQAGSCAVRDFRSLSLINPAADPIATALEVAYPGLTVEREKGVVRFADGRRLTLGDASDLPPDELLDRGRILDQFKYVYPLDFDLQYRKTAWVDPGRVRNDAFFRTLYFPSRAEAVHSLTKVVFTGAAVSATFSVTRKHCVHVQLAAALAEIAAMGPTMDRFFRPNGGSFKWRRISGTNRLSPHSFGIAVDINPTLGQYWRWSGARPGAAGDYVNRIPATLVATMERYGFIWGGKWHHFDGMHFEYRPEMILHGRLMNP